MADTATPEAPARATFSVRVQARARAQQALRAPSPPSSACPPRARRDARAHQVNAALLASAVSVELQSELEPAACGGQPVALAGAGGAEDRRRSDVDLGDFTLSRAADAALEEARRRCRRHCRP